MENSIIEMTIARVCKPGEENKNGKIYDMQSYKIAIDKFMQKINNQLIPIHSEYISDNYTSFTSSERMQTIKLENSLGRIIEATDEYITLEIKEDNGICQLLKENNLLNRLTAGMRYIGNCISGNVYQVDKIITFDVFIR